MHEREREGGPRIPAKPVVRCPSCQLDIVLTEGVAAKVMQRAGGEGGSAAEAERLKQAMLSAMQQALDQEVKKMLGLDGGPAGSSGGGKGPSASSLDGTERRREPLRNEQISTRIRRLLGDATFASMAGRVGFHHETVRRYLAGRAKIPAEFVAAVSAAYRVDASELLLTDGDDRNDGRRG